jgi:hypothetical protein
VPALSIGRSNLIPIAVGYAGGLAALPWLPGPHFGAERSLAVRAALAFLIPTAAFVTCATLETLFRRSTSNPPHLESGKAIRAVSAFTALFMVGLHGLVLVGMLGFPISGLPLHRLCDPTASSDRPQGSSLLPMPPAAFARKRSFRIARWMF